MPPKAAPAAAVAPKSKTLTVVEFAVRIRTGDYEQGVFSNASESVARHKRDALIVAAQESGAQVPAYELVKRECVYPLDADGKPLALGSTCEETILE